MTDEVAPPTRNALAGKDSFQLPRVRGEGLYTGFKTVLITGVWFIIKAFRVPSLPFTPLFINMTYLLFDLWSLAF